MLLSPPNEDAKTLLVRGEEHSLGTLLRNFPASLLASHGPFYAAIAPQFPPFEYVCISFSLWYGRSAHSHFTPPPYTHTHTHKHINTHTHTHSHTHPSPPSGLGPSVTAQDLENFLPKGEVASGEGDRHIALPLRLFLIRPEDRMTE